MDEKILKLVNRMSIEGKKTENFFRGIQDGYWDLEVYSEGAKWRIRDILSHLVGAEDGMARLIQNVLDGGEGTPEDFNLDAYNERKAREISSVDPLMLIERFENYRKETVSLISRMTVPSLDLSGRHPWLGEARIEDILKLMYRHALIHQRDIRKKIKEL